MSSKSVRCTNRLHKLARLRGKSETEADELAALLLTPIVRPSGLIGALVADTYRGDPAAQQAVHEAEIQWITQWITEKKVEKLRLLGDLLGVDLSQAGGREWALAFLMLAEVCLEGFEAVDKPSKGPGAPPGPRDPGEPSRDKLVREVEVRIVAAEETGEATDVKKVCEELTKRGSKTHWEGKEKGTLETAYYKHKKIRQAALDAQVEGPSDYWKFLETAVAKARQNSGKQ